jgi:cystathionine beta-synthase
MQMVCDNILETIGKTPMIELQRAASHISARVFAKMEAFNPGHSAKDRIALHMIERAERTGELKKGGTLVDATSGNTGFSLAMVAAVRGYQCVLTVTDKASEDKINNLRALGAKVFLCKSSLPPDHPDSYYMMAKRLAREIPDAFYVNQNYNLANGEAHYLSTGPEIWEQTEGKVTYLLASASTGGTLSGAGAYLKEMNPDIKLIGVDAYGSVLKKYHETGIYDMNEIYPYRIEGTGKNIIPANMEFDIIDRFVKVTDRDSALKARNLARKEGILAGYSSGACLACLDEIAPQLTPDDVVVLLFSDHGSKYVSKVFSDKWMEEQGFMENLDELEFSEMENIAARTL